MTGLDLGSGAGPKRDVIADNLTCTHQGGSAHDSYQPVHKVLGPFPLHVSTYDLTRHGIPVSG
jgi:arsenite oxidase small subunit